MGLSAMSQLAINATEWHSAKWAYDKGLYAQLFDSVDDMDEEISRLATVLAKSSPEAMAELKRVFWQGTEHWDQLLSDRAAISGTLVLSDFTINAINAFKKK
jgi:methylglutaconyl-CoA hydratase